MKTVRIVVAQHGGRHEYAIPRMLEAEGILMGLYTDTSTCSMLGRCAISLSRVWKGGARKLRNRCPRGIPEAKVFSSDRVLLLECVSPLLVALLGRQKYEYMHWGRALSGRMKRWGVDGCNGVYNMYCENLEFIRYARARGLKVITDVYINPCTSVILAEEYERFPEWRKASTACASIDAVGPHVLEEMIELSDLLLCPSQWTVDGLCSFKKVDRDRIRVVPYGCSRGPADAVKTEPEPGRIFFAGGDPLRKGLPYLAEAAKVLRSQGRTYDFRVAGVTDAGIRKMEVCRNLTFLGRLSREEMKREYAKADLFVLPTLSEGFPSVCMEALAVGLPVVTTRCAGTMIRDGEDGIIVPERDSAALADTIESLVTNRRKRNEIARHCLQAASLYSEENWRRRLMEALHVVM